MKDSVITIKLKEAIQRKGVTLYWLAKNSGVPYVTLWAISQKETQDSISLPVLSRLCVALECGPGDLLHHVLDDNDKAIASLIKNYSAKAKARTAKPASKKGGAK